jgi:PEP-CTERM motif
MIRNKALLLAGSWILVFAVGSIASADAPNAVADYGTDFQTGTPKAGWSYRWNASTALESSPGTLNVAGLVPLVADGSNYETQANGTRPDAAPGSNTAATATSLFPGQGSAQAADGIERFVVAAYTISEDDAANGTQGFIEDWSFAVPFSTGDGVNARFYVNSAIQFPGVTNLPPGAVFSAAQFPEFIVSLGTLSEGDTVYVAVGSNLNDSFDELIVDYSIVLKPVPEPASFAIFGLGAAALVGRRRRGGRIMGRV